MRFPLWLALCGALLLNIPCASTRALAAPIKADAKATTPVTIKVLTAEGAPVEGATIRVRPVKMRDETEIIEARTDAAGVAKIVVPLRDAKNETVGYITVAAPEIGVQNGALKRGDNVFSLLPSAPIGGRVIDTQGKAVSGVTVVATTAMFDNEDPATQRFISLRGLEKSFTAKTDAAGKWKFLGLPAGARISVALQDERFENAVTSGVAGKSDAPDLVARPGAVLEGAVVDESGKPVAGVKLFAQTRDYQSTGRAETDAAGRYRMASLKAGSFTVYVFPVPDQKLVAPALQNVVVGAGASTRAPDLVMMAGALIEGVVRDEKGAPAADVSISAQGDEFDSFYGVTDAAGKYQVRVVPGEIRLTSDNAEGDDFYAEGAGSRDKPVRLTVKKGETVQQDFSVKRALTLSGVTVDESGKPVTGARVFAGESPNGMGAVSDADGKWQLTGQKPGTLTLNVAGEWQLAAPAQIALPRAEPLRLVVRAVPFQSVASRVVTADGKPIEGARVLAQLRVSTNFGGGVNNSFTMRALEAKSDAAGRFSLDKIAPNNTLENATATLDGFALVSGGKAEKSGDSWTLADLVMQPLDGKVSGRVLAIDGTPAANAFVVADSGAARLTPADANGNFTLTGLPVGEAVLTAFSGADVARQKVAAAKNAAAAVTLQLGAPPPVKSNDVERGFAILSRVLADSAGKEFYSRGSVAADMEPFDRDLAVRLREKTGVPDGGAERELIVLYEDPARAVRQADELSAKIEAVDNARRKIYWRVTLGLLLAPSDAPRAAEILARTEADLKAMSDAARDENPYFSNLIYATTAALAARLKKPSAEGWIDLAMIGAERQFAGDAKQLVDFKRLLVEMAARGSLQLFEREAREVPLAEQTQALSGAIVDASQIDLPLALQLLEKLAAMKKGAPDENARTSAEYAFGRAAKPIIARLGETDPAAALELARRVQDDQSRALALALAARVQPDGAVREKLFREALTEAAQRPWMRVGSSAPELAAMAGEVDAALGEKLLRELLQKAPGEAAPASENLYPQTSHAALAFYVARFDAGAARLLIEKDYARLRRAAAIPGAYELSPLALAMSAIDVERALEMARALPESNTRYDTQRKIAQYVLADEETRRTLDFYRWNASDSWRPGTPARW